MNTRLVSCLFMSMLLGFVGAIAVLMSGGGPLVALAAYSLTGSLSLVPIAMFAAMRVKKQHAVTKAATGARPVYS